MRDWFNLTFGTAQTFFATLTGAPGSADLLVGIASHSAWDDSSPVGVGSFADEDVGAPRGFYAKCSNSSNS